MGPEQSECPSIHPVCAPSYKDWQVSRPEWDHSAEFEYLPHARRGSDFSADLGILVNRLLYLESIFHPPPAYQRGRF